MSVRYKDIFMKCPNFPELKREDIESLRPADQTGCAGKAGDNDLLLYAYLIGYVVLKESDTETVDAETLESLKTGLNKHTELDIKAEDSSSLCQNRKDGNVNSTTVAQHFNVNNWRFKDMYQSELHIVIVNTDYQIRKLQKQVKELEAQLEFGASSPPRVAAEMPHEQALLVGAQGIALLGVSDVCFCQKENEDDFKEEYYDEEEENGIREFYTQGPKLTETTPVRVLVIKQLLAIDEEERNLLWEQIHTYAKAEGFKYLLAMTEEVAKQKETAFHKLKHRVLCSGNEGFILDGSLFKTLRSFDSFAEVGGHSSPELLTWYYEEETYTSWVEEFRSLININPKVGMSVWVDGQRATILSVHSKGVNVEFESGNGYRFGVEARTLKEPPARGVEDDIIAVMIREVKEEEEVREEVREEKEEEEVREEKEEEVREETEEELVEVKEEGRAT